MAIIHCGKKLNLYLINKPNGWISVGQIPFGNRHNEIIAGPLCNIKQSMDNPINLYDNFFFSKDYESAIFQLKSGKVFLAKKNSIEELDIAKIIESRDNQVRYFKKIDGKKKWGVISFSGHEIIPPMYDYISPLIDSQYYKVFSGDYSWEFDDDSFDYFSENIDTDSWNGDEYIGTLKEGQWGLIGVEYDLNYNILIPPEFKWLILVDKKIVCCNIGGSLIKWYNGDDKEYEFSTFGGKWKAVEASKSNNRVETQLGTFGEVLEKFKSEYSQRFNGDSAYEYQFIFDSQKIY